MDQIHSVLSQIRSVDPRLLILGAVAVGAMLWLVGRRLLPWTMGLMGVIAGGGGALMLSHHFDLEFPFPLIFAICGALAGGALGAWLFRLVMPIALCLTLGVVVPMGYAVSRGLPPSPLRQALVEAYQPMNAADQPKVPAEPQTQPEQREQAKTDAPSQRRTAMHSPLRGGLFDGPSLNDLSLNGWSGRFRTTPPTLGQAGPSIFDDHRPPEGQPKSPLFDEDFHPADPVQVQGGSAPDDRPAPDKAYDQAKETAQDAAVEAAKQWWNQSEQAKSWEAWWDALEQLDRWWLLGLLVAGAAGGLTIGMFSSGFSASIVTSIGGTLAISWAAAQGIAMLWPQKAQWFADPPLAAFGGLLAFAALGVVVQSILVSGKTVPPTDHQEEKSTES
jgi:hypothetical protein